MAKNTGLGKGLDSLIPDISSENQEEETISLEDLLKKDSPENSIVENEVENLSQDMVDETEEIEEIEDVEDELEEELDEKIEIDNEILEDEIDEPNETEEFEGDIKIVEEDLDNSKSSDDSLDESSDSSIDDAKIIEEPINNIEDNVDTTQIIEGESHDNDVDVLLTKKQEEDICKVIEIVENNPRITLWSAKSAAVLRYLRKTEPEFSISNEASKLIEEAIAEKYPEIWTLFDHL
ncbi:MAG: AAA family ATPase [Methanobacteriaceae archaeon]|nr:AAA family ATPase [Methanobacteriaceae archaeon]